MSAIVRLPQPKAEIMYAPGSNRVYGWREELVTERRNIPLSGLVSIHSFAWTARRAMRRWLKEQADPVDLT